MAIVLSEMKLMMKLSTLLAEYLHCFCLPCPMLDAQSSDYKGSHLVLNVSFVIPKGRREKDTFTEFILSDLMFLKDCPSQQRKIALSLSTFVLFYTVSNSAVHGMSFQRTYLTCKIFFLPLFTF